MNGAKFATVDKNKIGGVTNEKEAFINCYSSGS